MHKAVLVHSDIHERPEGCDVGDNPRQPHADLDILDFLDTVGEAECLELLTGIPSRPGQLLHDIVQRGQPDSFGDIVLQLDFGSKRVVGHQFRNGAADVTSHRSDDAIALGMHGTRIELICGVPYSQETRRLLEGLRPETRNLLELPSRCERAVFVSVGDNILSQLRPEPGNIRQQLLAGRVHLDANTIDATGHDIVEALLQHRLVHVVLVLTDSDRLGVDLHQLGERIGESAPDGYRPADCHVLIGKLLPGHLRSRINRGAAFVDHHHGDVFAQLDAPDKRFGLAARGPIAYRNCFDVILFAKRRYFRRAGCGHAIALVGIDNVGTLQLALLVETDNFAPRAESRIDCQHVLAPQRRRQQQFAQIVREDSYSFGVGPLSRRSENLRSHRGRQKPLVSVTSSFFHLR